jgi:UDP-N-acetylglucosamine--N-acetylmuramyl-(pentapeptide) pyrophosphoryl-undecaprenol N-acetylglucosamine transferase
MMAALMGIRTAIHEQNVFPGITNKLLGKKVNNVFLGFEEAKKFFDSKSNPVFVGNPVRNENFSMTKSEAREKLNLKQESFILLSVGGSGGSKSLNKAIRDMIPQFVTKDVVVIHATGKFHYDTFAEGFNIEDYKENIKIYPYIENMGTYMAAADVIVCSAGAITLAEVNYLGKPSIVIPKKYTAENHQEYNAKTIESAGAGFCILEDELSAEVLREKLYSIMEDDKLRQAMEENSLSLSKENPAQLIYNILMKKSE